MFVNVRAGTVYPAIAIDKSGPAVARAGDTLHYTLKVTNPGTVPFPEDQVHVSDPTCNSAPDVSDKSDGSGPDGSPGHLDPGDVWTYKCSRKTGDAGEDCELSVVHNTATATGEAGGVTVEDTDAIPTTLTCPDTLPPDPPKPIDPPVAPSPPNPLVPPARVRVYSRRLSYRRTESPSIGWSNAVSIRPTGPAPTTCTCILEFSLSEPWSEMESPVRARVLELQRRPGRRGLRTDAC